MRKHISIAEAKANIFGSLSHSLSLTRKLFVTCAIKKFSLRKFVSYFRVEYGDKDCQHLTIPMGNEFTASLTHRSVYFMDVYEYTHVLNEAAAAATTAMATAMKSVGPSRHTHTHTNNFRTK